MTTIFKYFISELKYISLVSDARGCYIEVMRMRELQVLRFANFMLSLASLIF